MGSQAGVLSVNSENIFPVIQKWLYNEQDIFFRELISNCSDAIRKMEGLLRTGAAKKEDYAGRIEVIVDAKKGCICFCDNGIGMDAEEVEKYINQIAFSGAAEFLKQHRSADADDQIIGHFGLGFYSSFMAAERVTIDTQSYREDAQSVWWECTKDMRYRMKAGDKKEHGTTVTVWTGRTSPFLKPKKAEEIIRKYFAFMPLPILLTYRGAGNEQQETAGEKTEEVSFEKKQVNETNPLWMRAPEDCTKEDYVNLYRMLFHDLNEPVLWMHLQDEELGVHGILYFRSRESMDRNLDGTIRLYNNQVFVADNVKEVIPAFLLLQNGVIDCSNLPLMVSRSALHEDRRIEALNRYITEQTAYKLYGLYECERDYYQEIWPDLNPFVKYSCLKDKLFSSYISKFVIYQDADGKYVTLKEHLADISGEHENAVYYVTDRIQQAHYINIFKEAGVNFLYMEQVVDQPFIRRFEMKNQDVRFLRIDSGDCDALYMTVTEEETALLQEEAQKIQELYAELVEDFPLDIQLRKMKSESTGALLVMDEEQRRMQDTLDLYGAAGVDVSLFKQQKAQLFMNRQSRLVQYVLDNCSAENTMTRLICLQLYDLARLGQETLESQDMADFIVRTNSMLQKIML